MSMPVRLARAPCLPAVSIQVLWSATIFSSREDRFSTRRGSRAPVYLSVLLAFVRLLGAAPVSSGLRLAWNDAGAMRTALAERKA